MHRLAQRVYENLAGVHSVATCLSLLLFMHTYILKACRNSVECVSNDKNGELAISFHFFKTRRLSENPQS